MQKYDLYVHCSRGGMSRDSGLHASEDFDNDSTAISEMRSIVTRDLMHHYDNVECTIFQGDRKVTTFTICN